MSRDILGNYSPERPRANRLAQALALGTLAGFASAACAFGIELVDHSMFNNEMMPNSISGGAILGGMTLAAVCGRKLSSNGVE